MSQNEKIDEPTLGKLCEKLNLTNYLKKILEKINFWDFIQNFKESVMPQDRKQTLIVMILSITSPENAKPKPAGAEKEKKVEIPVLNPAYESAVKQLLEIFPDFDIEIIRSTVSEMKGDIEKAATSLSEMNKTTTTTIPIKSEGKEEQKQIGKIQVMETIKSSGNSKKIEIEEPKMPDDLIPLLRGDSEYKENLTEEEKLRALRKKEIEEENALAQQEKDEEALDLHEAAIKKTKELAAKYLYDDDEDELPILVNQDSTTSKTDDLENIDEDQAEQAKKSEKEEEKKPMTEEQKQHAAHMKQVDKQKRKYNKQKHKGEQGYRKKFY